MSVLAVVCVHASIHSKPIGLTNGAATDNSGLSDLVIVLGQAQLLRQPPAPTRNSQASRRRWVGKCHTYMYTNEHIQRGAGGQMERETEGEREHQPAATPRLWSQQAARQPQTPAVHRTSNRSVIMVGQQYVTERHTHTQTHTYLERERERDAPGRTKPPRFRPPERSRGSCY